MCYGCGCCLVTQLYPTLCDLTRLSSLWNTPGKDTGVGCHFLLQGIFPTQGSNPGLLHRQVDSLPLSHPGSPRRVAHYFNYDSLMMIYLLAICISSLARCLFRSLAHFLGFLLCCVLRVLSYFCIPVSYKWKRHLFWVLVLEGLIGLHKTIQLQLLQHYWLGHRLGLLWYCMVCLGNEQRSFGRFWDCTQVLHFELLLTRMAIPFLLRDSCPQ